VRAKTHPYGGAVPGVLKHIRMVALYLAC